MAGSGQFSTRFEMSIGCLSKPNFCISSMVSRHARHVDRRAELRQQHLVFERRIETGPGMIDVARGCLVGCWRIARLSSRRARISRRCRGSFPPTSVSAMILRDVRAGRRLNVRPATGSPPCRSPSRPSGTGRPGSPHQREWRPMPRTRGRTANMTIPAFICETQKIREQGAWRQRATVRRLPRSSPSQGQLVINSKSD